MPCWRNRSRLLPCPAVPNPIEKGCGTSPRSPHQRLAIPNGQESLPSPRVGSMDRHARSWCENSPPPACLPHARALPKARLGCTRLKRLIARRDGNRVRLYTRRGYDWSDKYPWIVDSLLSLRVRSIIVDGEAVWAGKDGKSDFDRLHAHDHQIFLYAFDLLELNGEDYRQHPLEKRKAKSEKIPARTQGMRFSEHLDDDGESIFEQACKMGLEGIALQAAGFSLSKWSDKKLDGKSKILVRQR
jgi:bifunctional non-homologous end joining protein LigD